MGQAQIARARGGGANDSGHGCGRAVKCTFVSACREAPIGETLVLHMHARQTLACRAGFEFHACHM
eukprot:9076626-Alexandrium_andersonii.AAC.1